MLKLTVFKWWWGWNSDSVEEWLEQMEAKGLRLDKVTGIGTRFHFTEAEPKKVRYCIDFQEKLNREYIDLVHDDGWELIPMGSGWYVFRKEYDEERPNLYTDLDSLLVRNKKLFSVILAGSIPTIACWPSVIRNGNNFFTVVLIMICIFYLFAAVKLKGSIDLIKEKKQLSDK